MNELERLCPPCLVNPAPPETKAQLAEVWRLTQISQRKTRAKRDFPQVKTRSSYDRFQHNTVSAPNLSHEADFLPAGQSGQWDIIPRIREKRTLQYDVYTVPNKAVWIIKHGKWRGQKLHQGGFKKCCPDGKSSGRGCRRKGCAGCYCANTVPPRGRRWLILENFDQGRAKLIDPHGVHETGRKSGGKDHHEKDKKNFRASRPKRPDNTKGWFGHKHDRW